MFIVRSAFWLGLAFVLMAPKGTDFGAAATDLSQQAMAAGQQLIVSQIANTNCDTIECLGGKAVIATVLTEVPSIDPSMQDLSSSPVPFPRPRPDWMG
jgi:ABC-type siderophore export system fused ATPase/permease subunit